MSGEAVRPKVLVVIALVFLGLVVAHLFLTAQETERLPLPEPQLSRIEVPAQPAAEPPVPAVVPSEPGAAALEPAAPPFEPAMQPFEPGAMPVVPAQPVEPQTDLLESRIALLTSGEANERRATAVQLSWMTTDPQGCELVLGLSDDLHRRLEAALFQGLNDPDVVVSDNCRDALLGTWRLCDSLAVSEQFAEGLSAYRAGRLDLALETFQAAERLRGSVPPDLYRMKAQIYLSQGKHEDALRECGRALEAEKRNFLALLIVAQVQDALGNSDKALRALDTALDIYSRFAPARALRDELLKRNEPS